MLFTALSSPKEIESTIVKHLHKGAVDPNHPFHFVNVSTLDGDQPDCRNMVLREVSEDLELTFYTDTRSEKVAQIVNTPKVCLLFYHAEKRCQVKILGKAVISSKNEACQKHYEKIQPEATKAYQSVLAPKAPLTNLEEGWNWEQAYQSKFFSLLTIKPEHIECLQLGKQGHIRIGFMKVKEAWHSTWLVP